MVGETVLERKDNVAAALRTMFINIEFISSYL